MRILITGGCGFIESHIVENLITRNNVVVKIRVVDDLTTGSLDNIEKF